MEQMALGIKTENRIWCWQISCHSTSQIKLSSYKHEKFNCSRSIKYEVTNAIKFKQNYLTNSLKKQHITE